MDAAACDNMGRSISFKLGDADDSTQAMSLYQKRTTAAAGSSKLAPILSNAQTPKTLRNFNKRKTYAASGQVFGDDFQTQNDSADMSYD